MTDNDDGLDELLDNLAGHLYDRHGNPISFRRFAELKGRYPRTDIVGLTQHGDDIEISTVWLGWPAGKDPNGRPFIFETAVFIDGSVVVYARYATETEAARGHVLAVKRYRIEYPLPGPPA